MFMNPTTCLLTGAPAMRPSTFALDPTDGSEHIAWIREFWPSLERYTRGFYVNDLGDDATVEDINANYRGNFNRLVAVKNRYDPNNLFRLNANVEPSV